MNIETIVLAAGLSERVGVFKMELPLGDKTLIERTIEGPYQVSSRIIVVGGYKIERLREILSSYEKVEVVFNKNYKRGMFSSVKEGVKYVQAERFFILPGDCPLINENVYRALLEVDADIVIPAYRGKKGHPVLLRGSLKRSLLEEPDDSNLRNFIKKNRYAILEVPDNGIIIDVDTVEDYEKIRHRFEKKNQ